MVFDLTAIESRTAFDWPVVGTPEGMWAQRSGGPRASGTESAEEPFLSLPSSIGCCIVVPSCAMCRSLISSDGSKIKPWTQPKYCCSLQHKKSINQIACLERSNPGPASTFVLHKRTQQRGQSAGCLHSAATYDSAG